VERWRKQMEQGYQVVYVKDGDKVVAAAGYRFLNTMAWGHILYIDDLVALQTSHRTGLGTLLLQHLQNEAKERGSDAVHRLWRRTTKSSIQRITSALQLQGYRDIQPGGAPVR
jgi:hypothetical protein